MIQGDPPFRRSFRLHDRVILPELNEIRGPDGTSTVHPKAMDVLVALAVRKGEVVSKQELLDTVWAGVHVGEDVLSTAIWELRRALEDDARTPRFIRTVPRRGYGLVALPQALETDAAPVVVRDRRERRGLLRWAGWTAMALLLLIGFWVARSSKIDRGDAAIRSLAVLPIDALSGDPPDEALAAGLTDTLITDLARLEGVRLVSRTTMQASRWRQLTVPEIGRELDVDAVVEGN